MPVIPRLASNGLIYSHCEEEFCRTLKSPSFVSCGITAYLHQKTITTYEGYNFGSFSEEWLETGELVWGEQGKRGVPGQPHPPPHSLLLGAPIPHILAPLPAPSLPLPTMENGKRENH